MKKIFRDGICFGAAILFAASCSMPGNDESERSKSFSADTTMVHHLLDSFNFYLNKNQLHLSVAFGRQALSLSEKIKYDDGMTDALRNLGLYYGTIGDNTTGLEYQLRALKINEKYGNTKKVARNLSDIGIVHYSQKTYGEALNYFQKSMSIHKHLENKSGMATVKFLMAICFARQGQDSTALQYFYESISEQMALGNVKRVAECEQEIGDIYLKRKEFSEALKYYNNSYKHFEEANEPMGYALIDISLAKLFLESKQHDKAVRYAWSAIEYFNNVNYPIRAMDASEVLHKIYAAQGKFDKAYEIQNLLTQQRDSIQGEENSRRINALLSGYEMEKSQAKMDLQQRQIETTRTLRNFFMIGFGIVALLAFLTFRQYRIKNKTAEKLEVALHTLEKTQEQLVYTEKMSSLGRLSAGIAHEIQNPLNFVNNFSDLGISLIDELKSTASEEERDEILSNIKSNLRKISEHGKRADGIVKSMLEHTHIGSREKRPTDINYLANEFFTLAFQSFRAKEPGFTCEVEKLFDKNLPAVNMNPQDISRVLINLFNNALYALNKKKVDDGISFSPAITLQSRFADGRVYFSVKDNGTGIPNDSLKKIFQPFFTTKAIGEGTGLGLSLSHEIITQGHGGTLEVKTAYGEGCEFIISLPA